MRQSFLSERAEVRDAGRKGRGIYATTPIHGGATVAAFGGWICDRAEFDALCDDRRVHAIQIDDELYMVGSEATEPADLVNHSCVPNAGIVGNILLVAMRDIAADEEICFDYAMCDSADYDEFICSCGAESCRGVVTSADWRIAELQDRYRGWMSSYLQRRIDAEREHPASTDTHRSDGD